MHVIKIISLPVQGFSQLLLDGLKKKVASQVIQFVLNAPLHVLHAEKHGLQTLLLS
jgi:hypothetical protein